MIECTYNLILCGVCTCLYHLDCPDSLLSLRSKTALYDFLCHGQHKPQLGLHKKSPIFLSKFGFSQQVLINLPSVKAYEIRPVGAELIHADRQTDGHGKLLGVFCEYLNTSKINVCIRKIVSPR
jgi:hypothetical protein